MKESSVAGKNTPQPTVSDSGVREVEWYDWTAFFAQVFKPVPKITKYHRNRFSQDIVGKVTCKEFADSCEVKCCILRPGKELNVITDTMPQPIVPKGLDDAHQWYLLEQVRQFCHSNLAKDITCPKPTVPKPGSCTSTSKLPPKKRQRKI